MPAPRDRPLLVHGCFSAWSEKIRWILDLKKVPHDREEYIPMLGDGRLKRLSGGTEVPVWVTASGEGVPDSMRIALRLEREYPEPALIPAGGPARGEVLRWHDWAGDVLSPLARVICTHGIATTPGAAAATVPPSAPWIARVTAPVLAGPGLWLFRRQYEIDAGAVAAARERMPGLLESIGLALEGDRPWLVGDGLTLADVAVASALLLLDPPADQYLPRPMPAALRAAFTDRASLAAFPAVFAWRDRLYRERRSV
jgi:glutathione S-transferase